MLNELIQTYINDSAKVRAKMQCRLFEIFTETTGYRPEDLCLVRSLKLYTFSTGNIAIRLQPHQATGAKESR